MAPLRGLVGECCHFGGFIALAAAMVLPRGRRQHACVALGLLATGVAQATILTTRYVQVDAIVSVAVAIAKAGEVIGVVALGLVIAGLTGRRRTFVAGWRCFAVSVGVLCASQVAWAIAFARHGDTYWVMFLSFTVFGGALLTHYLYRYVPFRWLAAGPSDRRGRSC